MSSNEKIIKSRQQQKSDVSTNWKIAGENGFIPKKGEIIVYDNLNKIKIGDGIQNVNDLSFTNGGVGLITKQGGEIFNDYENNQAAGLYSHAEGNNTIAESESSHAEGSSTTAVGDNSHAEGIGLTLDDTAVNIPVIGNININIDIGLSTITDTTVTTSNLNKVTNAALINALDQYIGTFKSFIIKVKYGTSERFYPISAILKASAGIAAVKYTLTIVDGYTFQGLTTDYHIVDAQLGVAYGLNAHAENEKTNAIGRSSHSEGYMTSAIGESSHTEGHMTQATGAFSHAEGNETNVTGNHAHAEGYKTSANEDSSHSEGSFTQATGICSHAEGDNTIASGARAHAEGYQTSAIGDDSHAEGFKTSATGSYSHAEGQETNANNNNAHAEGYKTTANADSSHAEGNQTQATGMCSHAEGYSTIATGYYTHAEGQSTSATGTGSHTEGVNSSAIGYSAHAEGQDTKAYGVGSHAEGVGTIAGDETDGGNCSHAEGYNTQALGEASHAEGYKTNATGAYSHAEGLSTTASGRNSHAEGYNTTASGSCSHAEGNSTIANGDSQHVQGKYNIADTTSAFIIGNGDSNTDRSNAMTVDWDGNANFAGVVTDKNGQLATENYVQQYVIENQKVDIIIEYRSTDANNLPTDIYCAISFQGFLDLMERNKLGNIWLVGIDQVKDLPRETLNIAYLPEDHIFVFTNGEYSVELTGDDEWYASHTVNDFISVDMVNGVASMSPAEIYYWVCRGRQVFFYPSIGQLCALSWSTKSEAIFSYISDDYTATYWYINHDSACTCTSLDYASRKWVGEIETDVGHIVDTIGNIETALDSIISIQESLVGLITFTCNGQELSALKGMTWGEWCDSEYNIDGFDIYIGSYEEPESGIVYENIVLDGAGDALVVAGTTELTTETVITPSSKIIDGQEYFAW